ncbi:MAG: hypothetical protein ACFFCI_24745, partial [Promethearchaeota archaeon]
LEMGLYFIIVGYFFLLFFYFLFIRFRTTKKLYWLFFSLFFLFFGTARVFFIIYYFFGPELSGTGAEIVAFLMLNYRFATFFTWLGNSCAVGVLGILLFPPDTQVEKNERKGFSLKNWFKKRNNIKLIIRLGLFIIPIIIGVLALTLSEWLFMDPDFPGLYGVPNNIISFKFGSWEYPLGRLLLNFIFMPLFLVLIPIMFIYLAMKTYGVLRKSYFLNAVGFVLYFVGGRILQGVFDVLEFAHVRAIGPPLLILLALLILVIANNYEQLR